MRFSGRRQRDGAPRLGSGRGRSRAPSPCVSGGRLEAQSHAPPSRAGPCPENQVDRRERVAARHGPLDVGVPPYAPPVSRLAAPLPDRSSPEHPRVTFPRP